HACNTCDTGRSAGCAASGRRRFGCRAERRFFCPCARRSRFGARAHSRQHLGGPRTHGRRRIRGSTGALRAGRRPDPPTRPSIHSAVRGRDAAPRPLASHRCQSPRLPRRETTRRAPRPDRTGLPVITMLSLPRVTRFTRVTPLARRAVAAGVLLVALPALPVLARAQASAYSLSDVVGLVKN